VGEEERDGYVQRLEAFAERHRERLAELLRAYGPGSAPAAHGRYALVGQPEALVICERMETARLLLYGLWEGELEDRTPCWTTSRSRGEPAAPPGDNHPKPPPAGPGHPNGESRPGPCAPPCPPR